MEIIYRQDGSIKYLNIAEYVQQGSNLVNKIFVSVEGLQQNDFTITANFTLPNGDTNAITGTDDYYVYENEVILGKSVKLTSAQTLYAGDLSVSISVIRNNTQEILNTYRATITVNKTNIIPADVNITLAQYLSLLATLSSYQARYNKRNCRAYETISAFNQDKSNLDPFQVVFVKDTATGILTPYMINADHTATVLPLTTTTWGNIAGTLANQTDLQNALNGKQNNLTAEQLSAVNSGITSTKVGYYDTHIADLNNPHLVTKAQVGLGSVENKTMDNQPTADSDNYVKSGGVKSYIDTAISTLKGNHFQIVDTTTYPTLEDFLRSTGQEGFIYLYPVSATPATDGYYQYIWENSTWLSLGTTKIDLSQYLKGVKVGGTELQKDSDGKVNVPVASSSDLGAVKTGMGATVDGNGSLQASVLLYPTYGSASSNLFISKGTLENVLDNETIRFDKVQSLSAEQKAKARANIGAGEVSYAHKITVW